MHTAEQIRYRRNGEIEKQLRVLDDAIAHTLLGGVALVALSISAVLWAYFN